MSKSKATVYNKPVIADEYRDALNIIIDACHTLYNYSLNPQTEIYRISRFVTIFASQVAYMDYLREETQSIIKTGDTFLIKRQIQKVDWAQETKAWEAAWSNIAEVYDNMITNFDNESTTDAILNFKTSEEILEQCRKFYSEKKDMDKNDAIKTLEQSLLL